MAEEWHDIKDADGACCRHDGWMTLREENQQLTIIIFSAASRYYSYAAQLVV
jgi:hypothetical protein